MITSPTRLRLPIGTALAAALAIGLPAGVVAPAAAQTTAQRAPVQGEEVTLSVGAGRLVRLGVPMSDVFVANDAVADVQVRTNNQIYIFGKGRGQTTVHATDRTGRVVYAATVRVGQNFESLDDMLRVAMPEAQVRATTMNGVVLLTGTVAQPADAEEAERLVQAFVGEETQVVSRLRTATPQQVMLKVTVAEVSRSLLREVGANLLTRGLGGNDFLFGVFRGNPGDIKPITSPTLTDPFGRPLEIGEEITFNRGVGTTIGAAGRLFGGTVLGTANLNELNGLVTILAEPTLTALSGETASFLAGGEFPILISQALGAVSVEYKQYGVSLAFTPYVLGDGRITMRVRPEVSELSNDGAVRLNGTSIPALTTRRTETTVELGSGQSMVISGLLRNVGSNSVDRAPFLGSLPIIGALFRSDSFRRNETELVIVVTPYLVQPVNPGQISLPTDGFRTSDDASRLLLGQPHHSVSGEGRPAPVAAPSRTVPAPGIGGGAAGQPVARAPVSGAPVTRGAAPAPGFDFQ